MGYMIIVYCDKCGLRVSESELGEGRAVELRPNYWLCSKCAPPPPVLARPPTSENHLQRKTKTSGVKTISSSRRNSGPKVEQAAELQPGNVKKYSTAKLALIGSGAMLLIIGILFVILHKSKPENIRVVSSGKTEPAQTAKNEPPKTDSDAKMAVRNVDKNPGPTTTSATTASGTSVAPIEVKTTLAAQVVRAERAKEADDEMANLRNDRAATLLEEQKAWFKSHAADPWQYRKKLKDFAASYRSTPAAVEANKMLQEMGALPAPPAPSDLMKDFVPDAQNYQLVYDIDLSKIGRDVVYDIDNRSAIKKPFDRIAYCMELTPTEGTAQYIYVSLDAFTDDLNKIGIPTFASGATFQQNVTNMLVSSNVSTIITGSIATGGNIEFWASNYEPANSANVPGASSEQFDFGDHPTHPPDGYGSMQIHNHDGQQTLFALNHWVMGANADIGIGNQPTGNPDWTFSANGASYKWKRLRVLVHQK